MPAEPGVPPANRGRPTGGSGARRRGTAAAGRGAPPRRASDSPPGAGAVSPQGGTVPSEEEDWKLWEPFFSLRPRDRAAQRFARHTEMRAARARRAPRRAEGLSREQIVRAAIAVADAEGADAISMRRIARELNAGTMSLYWYVASKEELLDLMIDSVQGEQWAPEPSGDWRQDMRVLAYNTRASLHRHRWMVDFLGGRPPMGPKSLHNLERALASFDGAGLDKPTASTVIMSIATYVLGGVLREVQEANSEAYVEAQYPDVSDAGREAMVREFVDRVRATGRFPHLLALIEAGVDPDAADTRDERFAFGLECLLDGIEARLPRSASRTAVTDGRNAR